MPTDVRIFEPSGDADQSSRLAQTVAALPATGGILLVAGGSVLLPNGLPIFAKQGLTICGAGPYPTKLYLDHATAHLLDFGADCDWLHLQNLSLHQLNATGTGLAFRMATAYTRSLTLRNLDMSGFYSSVFLNPGLLGVAENLRINGGGRARVGSRCFEIGAWNNFKATGVFVNTSETGFRHDGGAGVTFDTCNMENCETGFDNVAGEPTIINMWVTQNAGSNGVDFNFQSAAQVIGHGIYTSRYAAQVIRDRMAWLTTHNVPRISGDRGDASVTLVAGHHSADPGVHGQVDSPVQRFATTLTANRTVTLTAAPSYPTTAQGPVDGQSFKIIRTGLGAFTLDVGPGLKTIPASTAAVVDVAFDSAGNTWRLTGYQLL